MLHAVIFARKCLLRQVCNTGMQLVPSLYSADGENLVGGIIVADSLSLVPLIWETFHFGKQKC